MVRPAPKKKPGSKPKPNRPSPVSNIAKIGSLNRYADKEYANDLLHQVARLVAPIIHENNFKVGTLCEMFPKDANLLGLNVNRGQKILIRLRYHSNDRQFYPMGDIIGTFLHELTHNLYSAHDDKFYKFLDGLKKRFEDIQYGGASTTYRCEEETLGTKYNAFGGYMSEREKRIRALSKPKYKTESRKLGTSGGGISKVVADPRQLRQMILAAAERRMKDNKWCNHNSDITEIEPTNEELDIIEIEDEEADNNTTQKNLPEKYREVIDLTSDEYGESRTSNDEIIVVDACDNSNKDRKAPEIVSPLQPKATLDIPKSILRRPSTSPELEEMNSVHTTGRKVQFSGLLLPAFDEEKPQNHKESEAEELEDIQYTFSSSPKMFFGAEQQYPRRKLVADLNFDQILKKADKIEIHKAVAKKTNARKNKVKSTGKKLKRNQKEDASNSTATPKRRRKKAVLKEKPGKKIVRTITFEELL
ncbi:hypothetical protein G9P44_003766 [Scheffersomyces stipitis]|nr:hypothetical protein G9P44_003766 [Scheffersomyces stipitis]